MLRKLVLMLVLLAGLLLALPVLGQTSIAVGDTVTGTLTTDSPSARYTITAAANDQLSFRLTAESFDAYLTLLGPNNQELATDDDSAGGKNALIADFVIPADGTYTIVVDSYNQISTGDYQLEVTGSTSAPAEAATSTPLPPGGATAMPATAPAATGEIAIGDMVEGTLTSETPVVAYQFAGQNGQAVTITLTSDDFDAFLTLQDAAGNVLMTDDDRAGNLNARIEGFVLPADGSYVVSASTYNNASTGSFTLTLEAADAPNDQPRPTATPQGVEPTAAATEVNVPPSTEITVGASMTGTLTEEMTSALYTLVEGRAGTAITITLTSNDFDAFLILQDAAGVRLASDDDSAGNSNAQIAGFVLPADGPYLIVVGSYSNRSAGEYTLTLETADGTAPTATLAPVEPTATPIVADTLTPTSELPTATPTPADTLPPTPEPPTLTPIPASAEGEIAVGQTITGEMTAEAAAPQYTLVGSAGQLVTITLASDDFDAYLRLLDPASGEELASDDDSAGNYGAQITAFQLPDSGQVIISVESFSSAGGSYTLTVTGNTVEAIEYTQVKTGTMTADNLQAIYRFTGQAGDVITIGAEAEAFDAYLTLALADTNEMLAENDDSDGSLNPAIGPFALPETGEYLVTISSYNDEPGPFTVQILKAVLTPVTYGAAAIGEFTPETRVLYYSFTGQNGDVIHVTASTGGTLDTSLSVRGPYGEEIAYDDDSGSGFDPEVNRLVLTEDGTYTVLIKPVGEATGRVNVMVAQEVLRSLDQQPQTVQLSEKIAQDVLTFTGSAGEVVRLTARVTDNTTSTPVIAVTQNGEPLASATVDTVSAVILEFTVLEDGPVNVQISDYNFARVTLELSLERVEQ